MLDRKNIADHYFLELSATKVLLGLGVKPGYTIYLIIDSTFKNKRGQKLHNLKKFKTDKNKYIWGHCFVFGIIYYNGKRIPIAVKAYKSKKYCQKINRKFYTQVDLAVQIVNDFVSPDGVKVITLFDSYFSAEKMVKKVNNKGFDYVTVLAKNRVIENQEDMNISKRIEQHSFRWEIEIFIKELKQYLGLGDYQVRPYRVSLRHVRCVCMAYLFLIHFQLRRKINTQGIKKPLLHFRNRASIENFHFIQGKLKTKKGIIYLKDFYETLSKRYAA